MKLNKKFIAIPAIALAAGLGLAACGSSTGGYSPTTLAKSVQSTYNTAANQAQDNYSVSNTSCIKNSAGNTFTCILTRHFSGDLASLPDNQQTFTVTVAADGTWISS
jgi:ABC-type oligopeptide transport system substrate-binding subunit